MLFPVFLEEVGQTYREGGEQYSSALKRCDALILKWMTLLERRAKLSNTLILVTTNYSYVPNTKEHDYVSDLWLFSSRKILKKGTQLGFLSSIQMFLSIVKDEKENKYSFL